MSSSDLSEWESEDDSPTLERPIFKSKTEQAEWERKQRNREYRVAARREKRNRKADEKKQRKLNATILRRMTKNPDKYNKNVDRNRKREIEAERRKIYKEAISQAQRLAAIHDPSGKMFNVGPVVIQENGTVVSIEFLERKTQLQAERAAKISRGGDDEITESPKHIKDKAVKDRIDLQLSVHDGVNAARQELIQIPNENEVKAKRLSKSQQKKMAMLEERPPPPKPVIPYGIDLPEGEENWLALWNISEDELERRVVREKKQKAAERKALREKQKEGKGERRAARDERRRVYREKKLEWKAIKEGEKQQKRKLLRVEQEEAKRIEIEVNLAERRRAMGVCAQLGFTLENVDGVDDIKPKALGMKGRDVDFEKIEIGSRPSELKIKDENLTKEFKSKVARSSRVDLGKVADESRARFLTSDGAAPEGLEGDFVSLDFSGGAVDGHEFEALNYNHKLRRKLHRAIEATQIQKELLVRTKAKEYCEMKGIEVPPELASEYKPLKITGRRVLEDGTIETEKQERVRKRLELAEYNKAAKVLRQQAKAEAIEAGLRVFAKLTGKQPVEIDCKYSLKVENDGKTVMASDNAEQEVTVKAQSSRKRRKDSQYSEAKTENSASAPPSAPTSDERIKCVASEIKTTIKYEGSDSTSSPIPETEVVAIISRKTPEVKAKKRKAAHDLDGGVHKKHGDRAREGLKA